MNREERRAASKPRKKTDPHDPKRILAAMKLNAIANKVITDHTDPKEINEGDTVKMDVSLVKARRSYPNMSGPYKKFVDDNDGVEFTAHVEGKNMISFVEEPRWLFWSGDLIKVKDGGSVGEEHN